jgi:hypothetical protein
MREFRCGVICLRYHCRTGQFPRKFGLTVAKPPGHHIPLGDLSSVRVLGHGAVRRNDGSTVFLSPGASEQMKAIQSSDGQHRPSRRSRLVNAAYVLALAIATLGWMWFIVWIAMQFI